MKLFQPPELISSRSEWFDKTGQVRTAIRNRRALHHIGKWIFSWKFYGLCKSWQGDSFSIHADCRFINHVFAELIDRLQIALTS